MLFEKKGKKKKDGANESGLKFRENENVRGDMIFYLSNVVI